MEEVLYSVVPEERNWIRYIDARHVSAYYPDSPSITKAEIQQVLAAGAAGWILVESAGLGGFRLRVSRAVRVAGIDGEDLCRVWGCGGALGSIQAHKQSQKYWVQDKGPRVEANIGPIGTYRDPVGVHAEWEGFAAMVNEERTRTYGALVAHTEDFIASFSKPEDTLCSGREGSAFEVQVGVHELLGHSTDKLLKETSPGEYNFNHANLPINPITNEPVRMWYKPNETWGSVFGDLAASYEECHAELVAMYLSGEKDLISIFGHANDQEAEDVLYIQYLQMARAGLFSVETWDAKSRKWGLPHSQARYFILQVFISVGDGFVTFSHSLSDMSDLTISIDRSKILTRMESCRGVLDKAANLQEHCRKTLLEGGKLFNLEVRTSYSCDSNSSSIGRCLDKTLVPPLALAAPYTPGNREAQSGTGFPWILSKGGGVNHVFHSGRDLQAPSTWANIRRSNTHSSIHPRKHPPIQHSQPHPPAPTQQRKRIINTIMQRVLLASRGVRGGFGGTQFRVTYGSIGIRGCSTDVAVERSELGLFDAILMAKSSIGTMESLKHDAKQSLANALKVEELHVKKVNDSVFVGNQRGLDIAGLAQRLDKKVAELEEQIKTQKGELESAKGKFDLAKAEFDLADSRHEERLRYLLRSDDSYQTVRDGFLSVYKRDYLGTDTKRDREIIAQRNTTVHWGDAHRDAVRYTSSTGTQPPLRTDPEVFEKLYGLLPEKMDKITNDKTVKILNTHAGVLSSDRTQYTQKFTELFAAFVTALEKSGFDETYPDDKDTEVTLAYDAFVKCIKKEVKGVKKG
ncbi:peptidase family M49-domain-containing protein [Tuber borchii]|uniref:Peptidase family M49-domain-containing protein n=1 Tax=Tuber borchii TaxID=42251 RepID=A0A2T6ZDB6_TUBBO|nr:peptidase family M49-domain-containing protein [Tuber borchii]